ncbi:MAG: SDR family oxidoreductase [Shinella zoogloeoides]|uniref:SDR family oxidoreductase n=1 Tax=Shinella zoogloeoides TaxID=352475 RepID=UPI003C7420AE
MSQRFSVLVLGATGFIGSVIAGRLREEGHAVTGLGRHPDRARNQHPDIRWLKADLNDLGRAGDWAPLLRDQDIVVNCAGALQDGLHDDLAAAQERAMLALYEAAKQAGLRLVIQISANTMDAGAETAFLSTKRAADRALASSGVPYIILRPAVVIGRNAFGGTALLRSLSALPGPIPLAYADSPVATVSVEDVATCVARAVTGMIPADGDYDLAAAEDMSFRDLVALHRAWLGLPPARILALPGFLAGPVSALADLAGKLGWRSAMRSTAIAVMAGGVSSGHQGAVPAGVTFMKASQALARHPAGVQDLWFARLYLLKPLIVVVLSIFWMLSGLIPLFDPAGAASFLRPFMPVAAVWFMTFATCAVDIALGLAVLYRPWTRRALLGMLIVSAAYLAGGTILTPGLWLDPLGPFVKVLPSMVLAGVAIAILEER